MREKLEARKSLGEYPVADANFSISESENSTFPFRRRETASDDMLRNSEISDRPSRLAAMTARILAATVSLSLFDLLMFIVCA